ncbi:hypothetical protein C0580_04040 [Candidatus Parcubacteria bacterium]|nr:MAG: hypothetical protein C0580_04040 [Candidatus Parcubacteria bacterium]
MVQGGSGLGGLVVGGLLQSGLDDASELVAQVVDGHAQQALVAAGPREQVAHAGRDVDLDQVEARRLDGVVLVGEDRHAVAQVTLAVAQTGAPVGVDGHVAALDVPPEVQDRQDPGGVHHRRDRIGLLLLDHLLLPLESGDDGLDVGHVGDGPRVDAGPLRPDSHADGLVAEVDVDGGVVGGTDGHAGQAVDGLAEEGLGPLLSLEVEHSEDDLHLVLTIALRIAIHGWTSIWSEGKETSTGDLRAWKKD